jgi:hypothetical protein
MAVNPIHYDLFRIRIYAPDGQYLMDGHINSDGQFYCSGLVPGQAYNIVFTYDNALLLCLSFTCRAKGRVVLISPAHLLFNCGLIAPRASFVSAISGLIKGGDEMEIVGLGFERRILQMLMMSGKVNTAAYFRKHGFYMFKAGEELISKQKKT